MINKRRGPGRPPIYDGRNPDKILLRERLAQRAERAGGGDRAVYWLQDEVEKVLGRRIAQSYVSMVLSGDRRNPQVQRAVAWALGLSYAKAFPKPEKPLSRAEGRLMKSTSSPCVLGSSNQAGSTRSLPGKKIGGNHDR